MHWFEVPAKINWFLEITGKRPDGYHELVTVMQTISLCDRVGIEPTDDGKVTLSCNLDLGPTESNLAWRAAELLRSRHAPSRGARMVLEKRIPHGAGLGGGSSDASTVLVALNELWGLSLTDDALRELAAELGSDCAFFVAGGTALCTGRGEKVRPLPDLSGVTLVILYPKVVVKTVDVYREISRGLTWAPKRCYLSHDADATTAKADLGRFVFNRLQEAALRVSPEMRAVWEATSDAPGVGVRFVSGSGSSMVFLPGSEGSAQSLKDELARRKLGEVFVVQTIGPRGTGRGECETSKSPKFV